MSSRKATESFCFVHTTQNIYEERKKKSALERLVRQATFKFRALWSVRDGKGLGWSASIRGRFITGKWAPGTHWMGPRAGLGAAENKRLAGQIGRYETSVTNRQSTLRNIPEERRPQKYSNYLLCLLPSLSSLY